MFQALESPFEAEDLVTIAAMETSRLVDINRFGGWNSAMNKSSGDITLYQNKFEFDCQNHDNADSRPLNNRSPRLKIIYAFLLPVTASAKPCFEFLYTSIWISFEFECLCAWEDVYVRHPFDVIPTVKVHYDRHQLIVHRFPPLSLEGASDGCVKRRGVVRFFCFFNYRASFKNARVSNVIEVDTVIPIVPSVNRHMISEGGETI